MAYYRKLTEGWRLTDDVIRDCLLPGPCDVVAALCEAGHLPDPEKGMNARDCEWVSLRRWTYTVCFDAPAEEDERVFVEFGRLHGSGSVSLNGECLGAFSDGAARFDLTGSLRPGGNTLSVCFDPACLVRPGCGAPLPKIGVGEAPLLRMTNCVTVEQLRLSSRLQDGAGLMDCEIDLTAHVSGKYLFRYAVSLDGEAVFVGDFEEKLPAARRKVTHVLSIPSPALLDAENQDETVYAVKLTLERGGVGCDVYHMETAFRPGSQPQRCALVRQWPVPDELMDAIIGLNADSICLAGAAENRLVKNDFFRGLTVVQETECLHETGMLTEASLKKYAAGGIYWPPDSEMWRLRGGQTPDSAQMRSLTGGGVSMGAEKYARLTRYLQAAQLSARLHALRREGKRAVVPVDEAFCFFMSDALMEKDGALRPAAYAVRAAWKARHVFTDAPGSARPSQSVNVAVWAADETTRGQALTVSAWALTAEGEEIAAVCETVMSGSVRPAGNLLLNLPGQEGIIILRAEMKDMEGNLIDRCDSVLCVSADAPLKAFASLRPAQLTMEKGLLRNTGGTAAVSAWQCLLPGEESAQAADEWLNA